MLSADNLCKQFGPGPTKRQSCSGSKLFNTYSGPERLLLKKLILIKVSSQQQKHKKLPRKEFRCSLRKHINHCTQVKTMQENMPLDVYETTIILVL